jgi:FtsP/CotA-like multicopper oxidase with cupredoxin domain/plastocyanin
VSLFKRQDREVTGAAGASFALVALVLAFAAVVVAAHADNKTTGVPAGALQVTLSEFAITPTSIAAPVNGKLVIANAGSAVHNFTISGTKIATKGLQPGSSTTVDLDGIKAGTYTAFCSVAGHQQAGMQATVVIGGSGAASSAGAGMANMDFNSMTPQQLAAMNDQMDATMSKPVSLYVSQLKDGLNTKGVGNQPMKPQVLSDGTKQFTLTAELTDWEVSPGKTVRAWTYDGTVPGPWIKVNVGDHVRVVLDNKLPMSTAIHFHGLEVPVAMDGVPDVTQAPVKPGKQFVYEFVATKPELGMYHSHHDAQVQVPNGMLGVFEVGDIALPPNTGPITQEVPMVLNDAGVVGLSLNGKSFPATAPVIAHVGEWVEINYFNEGLQIHPMHLHGITQLVIAKDGYPLASPYTVDTISIAPGERYTTLVHVTSEFLGAKNTPGIWAFHCHILTHAEGPDGMFGMVTTFIVEPAK